MAAVAYPSRIEDFQVEGAGPVPGPLVRPSGAPGPRRRPSSTARLRPGAGVYRRRRLVALALAGASIFPVAHVGTALLGGGPLTAPEGQGISLPVASHGYVVQPGDTVWSIAHRFQPSGDERPLVDSITAELGGASLQPGQALRIP